MTSKLPLLKTTDVFAILENRKVLNDDYSSHLFWDLQEFIICKEAELVEQKFQAIERAISEGYFAVGWFSYELGYCLEAKLNYLLQNFNQPLFSVAIFRQHLYLNQQEIEQFLKSYTVDESLPALFYNTNLNVDRQKYSDALSHIHHHIKKGDTYQVNYTAKYNFNYQGEPITLYRLLRDRQRVEYSAYLNFPYTKIISLSPELFFKKEAGLITAKPMKGTAPRGKTVSEDQHLITAMQSDEKTLAENVMIVDLLRNDIGKFAKPSTVKVSSLFDIEIYETVLQMTSTITGKIDKNITLFELFKHLFPCGSVTGAPKISTMEIIRKLETAPRGVYTGAIGYVMPSNDMCMNVPIRTVILQENGRGELGVGGGLLFDSTTDKEYAEIILKGKFLMGIDFAFELIETILYRPTTGYTYLEEHLQRLKASSVVFNFICPLEKIIVAFNRLKTDLNTTCYYRVRLTLNKQGQFKLTTVEINDPEANKQSPYRILIAEKTTYSNNILFQHKTTAPSVRGFYDDEYALAKAYSDCDEIIFLNEKEEVTEGSRTNLFIEKEGMLYTPPTSCGLLNGIMRQRLLQSKNAIEKVLYCEDLNNADKILVVNSVRGIVEAKLDNK